MIRIENFLGFDNVDIAARSLRPGQHRQPLDVVAGDGIVGSHRRHARQPPQLFQRFFLDLIRHARGFDFLAQFLGVPHAFVLFTQFFLDGLHLLAQIILALGLLHPVLHFGLNLVAQLLNFQFLGEMLIDLFQANANVGGFERVLLVAGG